MSRQTVTLQDAGSQNGSLQVDIEVRNGQLFLYPSGYGDFCSSTGHGSPLMLELFEGKLQVAVWGDINQEDCTQIVSLEGAREELREEEFAPEQFN